MFLVVCLREKERKTDRHQTAEAHRVEAVLLFLILLRDFLRKLPIYQEAISPNEEEAD